MRQLRERRRLGIVTVPQFGITQNGIHSLIKRGWLDAKAANDQAEVGKAVMKLIDAGLNEAGPAAKFAPPASVGRTRFLSALRSVTLGLL